MPGQVGKLILETGIKGFAEVQELGKGLKQIANLANKTDNAFLNAAKKVKDFAGANRNSVNAIRGQIVALDKLKQSATIGGKAYKSLAADIVNLNTQLLTLSNAEKVAQASAAASAGLPDMQGRRKASDGRLLTNFSAAQLIGVAAAKSQKGFDNQVAQFTDRMHSLGVNTKTYSDLLYTLTQNTQQFNAALAGSTATAGNRQATDRIRAAGRSRFTIGTSSQGINPYTGEVQGLPVQGPVQRGPKRTAFMQQNAIPQFLQSFFETKSFKEALNEPLVPPMGFGPGGAGDYVPGSTGYRIANLQRDKKGRITGKTYDYSARKGDKGAVPFSRPGFTAVSYTHLTLPTILLV